MHKDYWDKEKCMMELEGTSRVQRDDLALIKAERNLKKSLACAESKEEVDYSNGKLSKENLTRLVIRLRMLRRNIELKGKALEGNMSEPSLLGVLKRKIQKFLLKIQAHGRVRRPKEKRGATTEHSTLKLPFYKKGELLGLDSVEEELYNFHNKGGRTNITTGHKKKHFKEDLKPP